MVQWFSGSVAQAVQVNNKFYHGLNVMGRNTVFPNDSTDPWNVLGAIEDISKDLPTVYMGGNTVINIQTYKMNYFANYWT